MIRSAVTIFQILKYFLFHDSLVIAGVFLSANIDKQPLLPMLEGAMNNLFHKPSDAFYTGRVMDLLFDGVEIDCSARVDDTFTAAICMQLGDEGLKKIDDDHFSFSTFGTVKIKRMILLFVMFANYAPIVAHCSFPDECN